MKHLFTFRQRPNETLTHSTTRGLNGGRMVVETTVKGRSVVHRALCIVNLLIALSFGFNQEAKAERWTEKCNIYYYSTDNAGNTHDGYYNNDGVSIDPNDATIDIGTVTSFFLKRSWALTNNNDGWGTTNMKWKYGIGSSNNEYNLGSNWDWCCTNQQRTFMFGDNSDLINYDVVYNAPNKTGQNTLWVSYVLNYNATDGGNRPSKTLYVNFTIPGFTTTSTSKNFGTITVNSESSTSKISFGTHYGTALTTKNCSSLTDFVVTAIDESGVTVKFAPKSAGNKSEKLTITDAHGKTCTITLTGKTQYAVTYKKGTYGTGNDVTNYKVYGTNLTLLDKGKFTYTGHIQTAWNTSADGTSGTSYALKATYTSEAALTLYPTWEEQKYDVTFGVGTSYTTLGSVTASVSGGAAITAGEYSIGASSSIVFTATPNIGYEVEGWYSDAACTGTKRQTGGNSYTIASLTKAETVYVKFIYTDYTINFVVDPAVGGRITQPETTPKTDAHYLVPFDIEVEENEGYTFVNWTSTDDITLGVADPSSAMTPSRKLTNDGGVELQESASQKGTNAALTDVNGTRTITAHLTETMHTVSVVSANTDMGTVSPSLVSAGITTPSASITATPKPGYYFTEWTASDGSKVTFGNSKSETTTANVTADGITITANFAERFYLRGSSTDNEETKKGMPGWKGEEKTDGLFTDINGNTATITRTLEAATQYKLKLGDMTGNSWGGSNDFESGDDFWTFTCNAAINCAAPTFTTAIAGEYTFTIDFSEASPKMKITYPDVPEYTLSINETRVHEETPMQNFIAGDGTVDNPYQFYLDEKMHLEITALTPVSGVTAMYQFGGETASSTTLVKDITGTTAKQSIVVKTYYQNGSYKSGEKTETIWYQGVDVPALHLTASWNEKEVSELSENPEVTIYYSTDHYAGAATVTSSVDDATPTPFMTITTETQMDQTYQMADQQPHRYDFAVSVNKNNRTFKAATSVSIYRLVEVRVKDTDHLMSKYYMWIDGTNPIQEEAAWPGNAFIGKLGDWHIFLVKYPSYTHFVLNDGNSTGAKQTVNVPLPDHDACYEIGGTDGTGKYTVTTADCPPILYVGNIADVTLHQGESQLITPDVDLDFGYDESQLQITFPDLPSNFTAVPQGKGFMLTGANQCGATTINVTYTLDGCSVNKSFHATVTHPSKILIQVKVPISINWNNHNDMWVYYWGEGLTETHVNMKWKDCVDSHDLFSAQVPLGTNGKVSFLFHEWTLEGSKPDQQTVDVQDVTASGCYKILVDQDSQSKKRKYIREGDYCWAKYQAIVNMADGTTYSSNKIEDTNNYISFYAPGKNETGSKSGLVRIIRNETQVGVVDAATFTNSGIYIAKIINDGAGLTDVAPYTGDYYIRTDAAGDWNNYKNESNKFTYFTPYKDALYDYYWVINKKVANQGDKLNIKACIGNDINDNLANMIEASNYTDGYGNINPDAGTGVNLRFGYNPKTNHFERSILRGSTAGTHNFLNIVGDNIYNDKSCSEELNEDNYKDNPEWSKFGDISNWVYEKNIYVKIDPSHPSSKALLKSQAFNGTPIYQLGYTRDPITGAITSTPAQHDILALGTTQGTYNLRIIYDFKTNRIVSAWSPIGDVTYDSEININADVLFVRHEEQPVAQVKLTTDNAKVSSLKNAYFVMEIDGATLKSGESMYWFSVPFDCEISSIFGVEGYVTLDGNGSPTAGTWGIQEYDGKTRAEKGWYAETATFWRWMRKNETLKKGNGYILVFDRTEASNQNLWKEITREEPCEGGAGCEDGKKTVTTTVLRLYFPSSQSGWEMTRSDKDQTVDYPDWTCEKKNRKAQDSNWRLLGTNSYSDIKIDKETQFSPQDDSVLTKAPNFVYVYDRTKDAYKRYDAVTSVGKDFQSFYCYMVQFSGRINWNQYTQSKPEVPTSVAARRVVAENELTNAQMTLSLKKGNNTEDNTYIYMDARATTDFDNQMDLTKITDTRANQIYSVTNEVEYAGNTLPVEDQIVPLTVNVNANGAYTFAMPEMTDGLEVYLIDNMANAHIDMAIDSYTVDLNKGKIADRFYLDVRVKERTTPTIIETIGSDGNPTGDRFIKVIQNDQLHIIRNGRIYNASGMELSK